MVSKVTLVYPFFHPANDNSIFRFPPLGLGYIAAALQKHGDNVDLVDCTFLKPADAIKRVVDAKPHIVGFYCMFSMKKTTFELAQAIQKQIPDCLLVVGGPLPSWSPQSFLEKFDVVAIGEGEQTIIDLVECVNQRKTLANIKGIVYKEGDRVVATEPRKFIENLDSLAFPTRTLFDNKAYKKYYKEQFGYTTTSMITSRGCPFSCDFCSRPIFGSDTRLRSVGNIVDEMEEIVGLGYERVWFADDCFTLNSRHLIEVCKEIVHRGVEIGWECLSRVDTMDKEVSEMMKRAGCIRVFFGIESGNDQVLQIMNKHITSVQARQAVDVAKAAGLKVGAFFILGYPGETDQTVLDTIHFASTLPLDYLSFTMPYPIPGTPLYERVKGENISIEDWEEPKNYRLIRHKLLYTSGFSEGKLKFAIAKGQAQFYGRKYFKKAGYPIFGEPFEHLTNYIFKRMH